MPRGSDTFLTSAQAVDAIASDFGQYGRQPGLFSKISPLILGGDAPPGSAGDEAAGFYLVHMLETKGVDAETLARICALVFETAVLAEDQNGIPGIRIQDQMDEFNCTRCGNCCRGLEHVCDPMDVASWERSDRADILSWVKKEETARGTQYRIWIDPRTGNPAAACPFLSRQPGTPLFFCAVQGAKPLVCREYPFTRKHARLTGCPGFDRAPRHDTAAAKSKG